MILILIIATLVHAESDPSQIIQKTQVFMWFGKLVYFQPDCVGTLVSKSHVLTSASCFIKEDGSFIEFSMVSVGKDLRQFVTYSVIYSSSKEQKFQFSSLKQVHFHPQVRLGKRPDLAILVLAEPFKKSENYFPIDIESTHFMKEPRAHGNFDSDSGAKPDLNCYTIMIESSRKISEIKDQYIYGENIIKDVMDKEDCLLMLKNGNKSGIYFYSRSTVCAKTDTTGLIKVLSPK